MLLKDASRTKYGRMGLAITVLGMPTMSIVNSLEPLRAINWNDARPWIVMLGAVILFLGWDLRKKRREIQKLDLEIAQLRSQQSLVRVATIHEMNSLIKDVEEISARKLGILGGTSPLEDFGIRFREFLVLTTAHFGDSHARANIIQEKLADVVSGSRPREDVVLAAPENLLCPWPSLCRKKGHEVAHFIPFLARELGALSHRFNIARNYAAILLTRLVLQISGRHEKRLVWRSVELC